MKEKRDGHGCLDRDHSSKKEISRLHVLIEGATMVTAQRHDIIHSLPLFVLMVASLFAVSPVDALDVCSVASRSEMARAIGEVVSATRPDGPRGDKDSGAQTWACTYSMVTGVLVVHVSEFSSADAARTFVTLENLKNEVKELQVQVPEEKGIGDRAFLFTDEEGIFLSVLKGVRYFAVTLAGTNVPADRQKALLRKVANMVLPKL